MLPPLLVLEYNLIFIHVIHIAEKSCEDRFRVASCILKKPAVYRVLPGSLLQGIKPLVDFFQRDLAESTLLFVIYFKRICIKFCA